MFVIRLLFILAALWIARKAWLMAKQAIENANQDTANTNNSSSQDKTAELMVVCKHCGTHLPQSSAVQDQGEWFCSSEHREAYQQSGDDSGSK